MTVVGISKRVTEECARRSVSDSIEASLSEIEVLSHQLCLVTKVKLKHSQGENGHITAKHLMKTIILDY